jgi:hypothetical protein
MLSGEASSSLINSKAALQGLLLLLPPSLLVVLEEAIRQEPASCCKFRGRWLLQMQHCLSRPPLYF